jgi:hypothetical protein
MHSFTRIEPLETRIAPAAVFTFTDVDGDRVTITTSKGTNADLAAILIHPAVGLGEELQRIDFSLNATAFAGTNLTVTATRTALGGDGLVNVGYIDAGTDGAGSALDLGLVVIRGDLGQIDAGDAALGTAGVKGLTVQSMGLFSTTTQQAGANLASTITGPLGFLKVAGSVTGASVFCGSCGPVTIGGSLVASGTANSGSIISAGAIGAITIGGSLIGAGPDGANGSIFSGGPIARIKIGGSLVGGFVGGSISSDGSIGPVTIGGSLLGAGGGAAIVSDGSIGPVTIGGSLEGGSGLFTDGSGSISAGGTLAKVTVGGSVRGGGGEASGAIRATGGIGGVVIAGSVVGGDGVESGRIFSGGALGPVTLGGSLVGGSADDTGQIFATGLLRSVKIGGNLEGGSTSAAVVLDSSGSIEAGRLGSLFIGGSITAGAEGGGGTLIDSGAVRATDDIGSIVVKGSLLGNANNPVLIAARGQAAPGAGQDLAIASLTVVGRAAFADILAGYDRSATPVGVNADAQIGAVVVGDWIASNLVAGVQDDADAARDDDFGEGDDFLILGGTPTIARIASITIRGTALGSLFAGGDHFGFVAQQIGSLKIGGTAIPLAPGPGNDLLGQLVGLTGDLRVREV